MAVAAEAQAFAAWVALHDRRLTTTYITQGHIDHFAGLAVLLERFPDARTIATPDAVALARAQAEYL